MIVIPDPVTSEYISRIGCISIAMDGTRVVGCPDTNEVFIEYPDPLVRPTHHIGLSDLTGYGIAVMISPDANVLAVVSYESPFLTPVESDLNPSFISLYVYQYVGGVWQEREVHESICMATPHAGMLDMSDDGSTIVLSGSLEYEVHGSSDPAVGGQDVIEFSDRSAEVILLTSVDLVTWSTTNRSIAGNIRGLPQNFDTPAFINSTGDELYTVCCWSTGGSSGSRLYVSKLVGGFWSAPQLVISEIGGNLSLSANKTVGVCSYVETAPINGHFWSLAKGPVGWAQVNILPDPAARLDPLMLGKSVKAGLAGRIMAVTSRFDEAVSGNISLFTAGGAWTQATIQTPDSQLGHFGHLLQVDDRNPLETILLTTHDKTLYTYTVAV